MSLAAAAGVQRSGSIASKPRLSAATVVAPTVAGTARKVDAASEPTRPGRFSRGSSSARQPVLPDSVAIAEFAELVAVDDLPFVFGRERLEHFQREAATLAAELHSQDTLGVRPNSRLAP